MNNSLNLKIVKKINFINFNQDRSCFCIGTDEGYDIYNCFPFKKICSKKIGQYGISYIAMLFRTNILALIFNNCCCLIVRFNGFTSITFFRKLKCDSLKGTSP